MSTRNFPANVEPIGTRFGANIPGKSGEGANVSRLKAAAAKGKAHGCGYLPPSKQGTHPEPTSFFRQRLGIHDELIRFVAHEPAPARKPTAACPSIPRIVPTIPAPTGPDWETQYHIAEANVILLRSENELLRARLANLGVSVTGKPGLATIR